MSDGSEEKRFSPLQKLSIMSNKSIISHTNIYIVKLDFTSAFKISHKIYIIYRSK